MSCSKEFPEHGEKSFIKTKKSSHKSCSPDKFYKEWVRNRVAKIKLLFLVSRNQGVKSIIQEIHYPAILDTNTPFLHLDLLRVWPTILWL
jgi:hypothetical protein